MSENNQVGEIGWMDTRVDNDGRITVGPRALADGRFCVIEDPGGATAALYQP